jgi:hypothetical protein
MAAVLGILAPSQEREYAATLKLPSLAWVYEELRCRDFDLDQWPPLGAFVETYVGSEGQLGIGVVIRDPRDGEPSDRRLTENYHAELPNQVFWPRWGDQWVDLQFFNRSNRLPALDWLPCCYRSDTSPVEPAEPVKPVVPPR